MSDLNPVHPRDPEWNAWVTLSIHVNSMLSHSTDRFMMFSERTQMVKYLWNLGYRPTEAQIEGCITRQRAQGLRP